MLSYLKQGIYNFATVQETKTKLYYPLSLVEVKRHLRIDNDFTDDDDYLENLIQVGTQAAENFIEKDISKTLTTIRIDGFDGYWVRVNEGNFLSMVSVLDDTSTAITTQYTTSKHDDYFQIEWVSSISSDPLQINYYSGYEPNATPAIIKQAILIKIADLYDSQRADLNWSGLTDNKVFENLLYFYKIFRF